MAETRKLYRSRSNRQVVGVCGGLAQYFNLDATLIRILFGYQIQTASSRRSWGLEE
jgi:phage shock protein C